MYTKKIVSKQRIAPLVSSLKKRCAKIVFTNGCFDILHAGHCEYLYRAKQLGDVLFVGVNSDKSVKLLKGNSRPINTLHNRLLVVASLASVDYICAFSEPTPLNLIKRVRPDILVKGGDWKPGKIVGADIVKASGGKVISIPFKKGFSTTGIIKKILATQ